MGYTVLFGGTFNPFHIGHYEMLKKLCSLKNCDKVLVIPDKIPPHKVCDYLADDKHRIEMCKIACEDFEKAEVCLIEFNRQGKSYTYDTVKILKEKYPDTDFAIACGGDMISSLDTWYEWKKLIKEVTFLAFSRNSKEAFFESVEKIKSFGAKIEVIDEKITNVSSSSLRKNLQKDLIPEKIYNYLLKNNLYLGSDHPEYKMYREILKKRLVEKRYYHSLAVADEAMRLAVKYGCNEEKAYLAGLLHDITKNASKEEHLNIFKTFGIILSDVEQNAEKLWHAISGSVYVRYILNIHDDEIVDAIRYHTTAKKDMSKLALILYLADFTSADRDYTDVDIMRKLVDISLEDAYAYSLSYSIKDLVENGRAVHIDTLEAYNQICLKGKV